jgi:hypothetical protein
MSYHYSRIVLEMAAVGDSVWTDSEPEAGSSLLYTILKLVGAGQSDGLHLPGSPPPSKCRVSV